MSDTRTVSARITKAGEDIQAVSESVYAMACAAIPDPKDRVELAALIGRLDGIGVGLTWVGRYELGGTNE